MVCLDTRERGIGAGKGVASKTSAEGRGSKQEDEVLESLVEVFLMDLAAEFSRAQSGPGNYGRRYELLTFKRRVG